MTAPDKKETDYSADVHDLTERLGSRQPSDNPRGLSGGDGGGGMNEVYSRLGALENSVQNVGTSIAEVKSDIRKLLVAGIAAAVLVIGAVISSHLIMVGNIDSSRKEVTDLIRYEVGRLTVSESTKN